MHRSSTFATPGRQSLLSHPYATLQDKITGPIPFFNPTRAHFTITHPDAKPSSPDDTSTPSPDGRTPVHVEWRARDNRKGRHVLLIDPSDPNAPRPTSSFQAVARGIWRMCTVFAWWDVSWWIGVLFSVGSAIFIACGFFYWLPLADPASEFTSEGTVAGGVTAFVGATLFQIGAILLIVEACNDDQAGCFGWALEQTFSHHSGSSTSDSSTADAKCIHHHPRQPSPSRPWHWWPTMHELRTHYLHEIGFLGSFILAVGATIFYISGILALPGVYSNLSQGVLYGVYWLAYLVGGILFVVSSVLYVIETQHNFYTPAPKLLGWWIGVWNLIGSVGWTLSAGFGYCSASWCVYQSNLSLLWASIAFTIGSLLLWYESLDKYVVEVDTSGRMAASTRQNGVEGGNGEAGDMEKGEKPEAVKEGNVA